MILSHRITLDPNNKQRTALQKAAGVARFTWNWALAEWQKEYKAGGKPSGLALKRKFNAVKAANFRWVYESPKDANQRPFANLQTAFSRFFEKLGGYPRFKKKGQHDSFYVSNHLVGLGPRRIRLPKIGWVRTRESLRFDGKILSATVSRTANKWFVSLQVDLGGFHKPREADGTIGVDLGVKHAAVTSDGTVYDAPLPLKDGLTRLRRANKALARKQKGSKRRDKAKLRLSKLHARISNIRNDFLHKLTTKLCRENQTVVIEDLAVKEMTRKTSRRRFGRAIADVGFHECRRQLSYKKDIYRTNLVVADRYYPSSKRCSACGYIEKKLALSEREFVCENCGNVEDRDDNAAKNLEQLAVSSTVSARGDEASAVGVTPAVSSVCEARTERCLGLVLGG